MKVVVPGFTGVNKLLAPQRLQDHEAQVAVNCDFRSLDLRPFPTDLVEAYGTTGPVTEASVFQFDDTHFIIENEDRSFARSPTFFADSSTDPRVFTQDETAGVTDTAWVKQVTVDDLTTTGFTQSYTINAAAKRLGVPKPANLEAPNYDAQTGSVLQYIRASYRGDTFFEVDGAAYAAVEKGDRLLVEGAFGFPTNQVTVTKKIVSLENEFGIQKGYIFVKDAELDWKNIRLKVVDGKTDIRFVKSGHNLQSGDQIIVAHRKYVASKTDPSTSPTGVPQPAKWPTGHPFVHSSGVVTYAQICEVDEVFSDYFTVLYYNQSGDLVPLELTEASGNTTYLIKKYALVSRDGYGFTEFSDHVVGGAGPMIDVFLDAKKVYQAKILYDAADNDDEPIGEWTNADTADVIRDRAYCVTFVNTFGDESEPSNPGNIITVAPGAPVTFTKGSLPLVALYTENALANYATIEKLRLYRTDDTGQFRLVRTEDLETNPLTVAAITALATDTTTAFVDTVPDRDLGEPLPTTGWAVPPVGLHSLANTPNGVVVGSKGRTVLGSVPFAPYAFPIANRVAADYDVVGLVPTSAGIVAITTGMPYLVVGENPETWGMQKLEYPYGCLSRRSIVDMGEIAIYASADGLVAVSGANVQILTKGLMAKSHWQGYAPATIIAGQVEGRYVASYIPVGGSTRKGFMYDPATEAFTDLGTEASPFNFLAFYNYLPKDNLYMIAPDGTVSRFGSGPGLKDYYWKSKWFHSPIPELMGVAQIMFTSAVLAGRSLTFTLWGFDNNAVTLIYTATTASGAIAGNRPFRLPYAGVGRYSAFQIELSGNQPVGTVVVARVMDELKED